MNLSKSLSLLANAQGRSEFVVVVFADIRGFSKFSQSNESPNIAMYVKRLYSELLTKYFSNAKYSKPTGDGLLLIFDYNEATLSEVSEKVITACLDCHKDFASLCQNDPMLNFKLPEAIGFGVSRGTACCLFNGTKIIDYSGHLLNLAARLNDLARPSGVVIDGQFKSGILSESLANNFKEEEAYIRSLAEDKPTTILIQNDVVELQGRSKLPISKETWKREVFTFTLKDFEALSGPWSQSLTAEPDANYPIECELSHVNPAQRKFYLYYKITEFEYKSKPRKDMSFNLDAIKRRLKLEKLRKNDQIMFTINYAESRLP